VPCALVLPLQSGGVSRWSIVTLLASVQVFIGMVMVLLAVFHLISGEGEPWKMGVISLGGATLTAVRGSPPSPLPPPASPPPSPPVPPPPTRLACTAWSPNCVRV
jgi:hypothetical protein